MAPTSEILTAERILEATEDVLRRHGPAKATVVDVARALGVSHGSVYRHFRTKAALREAVTKRWLDRTSGELSGVAAADRDPETRLRDWLATLFAAKRRKAGDDPELFATYTVLTGENGTVVGEHIADLTAQLTRIVEAGVRSGIFAATTDPGATARAVFHATARFHDPLYAREWEEPGTEADFEAVLDLVVRGLRP
ncbi:TetR family transcriptional regulator [Streptomyces chartreusis]|uniref:TetR family transcriptional regulator n=1 Tax=Streptomyces chartreusis TaxID=1969 RepID=UPI0033B6C761